MHEYYVLYTVQCTYILVHRSCIDYTLCKVYNTLIRTLNESVTVVDNSHESFLEALEVLFHNTVHTYDLTDYIIVQ